jgi:hypothetical protein
MCMRMETCIGESGSMASDTVRAPSCSVVCSVLLVPMFGGLMEL